MMDKTRNEKIKELNDLGITQQWIADQLGITRKRISFIIKKLGGRKSAIQFDMRKIVIAKQDLQTTWYEVALASGLSLVNVKNVLNGRNKSGEIKVVKGVLAIAQKRLRSSQAIVDAIVINVPEVTSSEMHGGTNGQY